MPRRPARKKNKKKLKKYLSIFSLFLLSSLFLSGYIFIKKVNTEYASAFSVSSVDLLSNQIFSSAFVVVDSFDNDPIKVEEAYLYIFDKSTLKTVVYKIPVDLTVDVPGRFSEEPFYNILALGNMETGGVEEGAKIMTKSIFKLLAFPVDRYIIVEKDSADSVKMLYRGRLKALSEVNIINLKNKIKTDHSLKELLDIYKFSNSLPDDRFLETEIGESYISNPALLDEELMDITFDSVLSHEKKSIAVLNGTDTPGVANFVSRVIRNLGGRVVATANTNNRYDNSILIVDDLTAESTRIVSQTFGIEKVILYSNIEGFEENEINRSDMTIILGLDFAGSL